MNSYTAFCQDVDGGTIWIGFVQAESVDDAGDIAVTECAAAWHQEQDSIHLLGIAAGEVSILFWEDNE